MMSSSDSSEKRDRFEPLKGSPVLQRGLRRNSISLPVLNEADLDLIRSLHMQVADTSETDFNLPVINKHTTCYNLSKQLTEFQK